MDQFPPISSGKSFGAWVIGVEAEEPHPHPDHADLAERRRRYARMLLDYIEPYVPVPRWFPATFSNYCLCAHHDPHRQILEWANTINLWYATKRS